MKVINGNNIDILKQYPDNYFDAIVTDPPYGLGKEPNAEELMRDWIEKGYHEINGSGFMGKEWDAFVPQPIFWKEVFRVLKHGGHVLAFYGTRTYDWGVMSMRFAGFEIRDSIQWVYGSGFPKSLSISKSIDKQNKNKWSNISKAIDNININCIFDLWKEQLNNVKFVNHTLKKNQIEIGISIQKEDFVQESVMPNFNLTRKYANAIIVELNFIEVLHYVEENHSIVQESAEVNIEQLPSHVKYVLKSLKDLNHLYFNIFSALLNVKELEKERISLNHKVEEVLKIWHGSPKSLKEEDIFVLCVEVINDLKHIILSQSKTFLNLDTKLQMECVSVINVIITEYMAVNLITNMVSILKSKAIDKMKGAEREVIGKSIHSANRKKGSETFSQISSNEGERLITEPSTEQAKQWEGWGSALKPANEPIVLARKPLEKGLSIAENVLKWGVGGINIDGCRIGFKNEADYNESTQKNQHEDFGTKPMTNNNVYGDYSMIQPKNYQPNGRFPANLILTHHPECECKGTKKVKAIKGGNSRAIQKNTYNDFGKNYNNKPNGEKCGFGDENGEETIEDWNCHEDCPIRIMDEQSGESKSTGGRIGNKNGAYSGIGAKGFTTEYKKGDAGFGDKGGASRFFKQVNFDNNDFLFCYLCSKSNNKEWESEYNYALNVKQTLRNMKQTKEHIALKNVTQILKEKADHLVKSVENLCPLCVTNFVQQVVEINNLDSNKEQLNLIRVFTQDYKKCTLLQNLVYYVETMESIDTTPTTQNLLRLFGYALIVIENYIKKDTKGKGEQKLEQSRFIYQPKASKSERNKGLEGFEEKEPQHDFGTDFGESRESRLHTKTKNFHPTVKPIKLMQYLVRLVTPKNGIVLDPFCGSGTTGIACKLEGFDFVGLEQDADYCKIAQARIDNYVDDSQKDDSTDTEFNDNQLSLF